MKKEKISFDDKTKWKFSKHLEGGLISYTNAAARIRKTNKKNDVKSAH